MKLNQVKTDCRYFKGDIPCKPHKNFGVHCVDSEGKDCEYYDRINKKILIIKLGAIGDVIRTTPLFTRLKNEHPDAKFYWLTQTPDVIPPEVDVVLKFDFKSQIILENLEFDTAVNLDKDLEACSLLNRVEAKNKYGFILKNGLPFPSDKNAEHKFLTGIFDDLNKKNTKNYLEEIFEICGLNYNGEKYVLDSFEEFGSDWNFPSGKKIIGLNTGCGGRWKTRLWADDNWIKLADLLSDYGYYVLFLGGEQEHEKNKLLSSRSKGNYIGHFPLKKFINLVNQCDLVVTSVTMATHITIALNKKIVLFNNIFNPNEFELFNLGEIISPEKECKCFFRPECINEEYQCMSTLYPEKVFETVQKILS